MRRILIVDDEPSLRDAIADVLADEGFCVQTAPDGQAAFVMLAATPPELLITDVMMPRLDGWRLLARVREQHPTLPVILMSAVIPIRATHMTPLPDHTVFLKKPFTIDELLATIMRLIPSQPHGERRR